MADISRLSRFVGGLPRDVDISTNTLHVASLKVGATSPVELTKVMTALLNTINTTGLTGDYINASAAGNGLQLSLGERSLITYYNNGDEYLTLDAVNKGFAATFQAPSSAPLNTLTIQAISPDMANWDFVCKLYSFNTGDNKPDALLATSNTLSVVSLPSVAPAADMAFTFPTPYSLVGSTRYYVVVIATVIGTGTEVDLAALSTTETPEWGTSTTDAGSTWASPTHVDRMRFKALLNAGGITAITVKPNGASLDVSSSGTKIADGGVIGSALAASAKQSVLESKIAAMRVGVINFTPTTGNTSDTVTTPVIAAATTDTAIGAGAGIAAASAKGIFVGTVSGAADIGKVLIRVNGTDNGVDDGTGDEIYAVLSEATGVYTLSYKTAAGGAYTIQASDTTAKFDFYFIEVMDLYSFGVDRLLMPAIGGVIDATTADSVYGEVTARMNADSTLQANINSEITSRLNGDSTLQSNLNSEITARLNGDSTLTANLNSEITARLDGDSTLQSNLDSETTSRINADSTLQANINSEITARLNGDSTLQSNLNSEITSRLNGDSTLTANLNSEITARLDGDSTLQSNLDSETTARLLADSTLTSNLNSEITSRLNGDSTLTANLNSEITARLNGDSTLTANLNSEITARLDGDSTLQSNLDSETTARLLADSTLTANLNTEKTTRANADSTLTANLNSEITSRSDADSTLQANLDSETTARLLADSTLTANLNTEKTTRANADSTLTANLNSEITARLDGDSTLQSNLDSETTARLLADSTLTSNLNTEKTTRANADSTLQANLDSETTARLNGDSTLQANLNSEITARMDGDSTLQSNLNSEITARLNGDSTLQSNLNSEITARINGDSTLQSNLDIEITARMDADSTLQSQITAMNVSVVDVQYTAATGGIAAGDVVILSTTVAGEVEKANASAIATCESVIGVSTQTKAGGALVMVRTFGEATVTTDGTNFDIGKRVYVGTTAGQATKTPPSIVDNVVYLLGGARATNKVFVNPNLEYVVM